MSIERFYSFDEISKIDALDFAKNKLSLRPTDGQNHFNCPWRPGSDSESFLIGDGGWIDFTKSEGDPDHKGGLISLVARVMFNGDIQQAQQHIGDTANLTVVMRPSAVRKNRAQALAEKGYKIAKAYDYHDLSGKVVHQVLRYEHPTDKTLKKEFVQKTPDGWTMSGVKTMLYRLPQWINSDTVYICEGEKDADNLAIAGHPSTTNPSGAGRWEDYYSEWISGKHVIIVEDNDQAGRDRTAWLLFRLRDIAASLRVIRFAGLPEHGDVSDWMLTQMGACDFSGIISDPIDKKTIRKPNGDYESVQEAKEANKTDFCNYVVIEKMENGKTTKERVPKLINDLVAELKVRFLGFPRRIGEQLFDHDRKTGNIETFDKYTSLFAWVQRKSKRCVSWGKGERYVTKEEFFEAIGAEAERYHTISHVPDWPKANGVYYAHGDMPQPDAEHQYFNQFCSLFNNLSSHIDSIMLKAFVAAPLYYIPGVPKPLWILDSEDGPGSGKTRLVEFVAELYGSERHPGVPVKASPYEINHKIEEVNKRLLSDTGRHSRIVFLDNVTGLLRSPNLASMITASHITGRRSYGKGEESRPNNLVYAVTANSATVDSDLAARAMYIMLRRPTYTSTFDTNVLDFIRQYRLHIIADLIDILKTHPGHPGTAPLTRVARFEQDIIQKFCVDVNDYEEFLSNLENKKAETNAEEEQAKCIEETIEHRLVDLMLGNEAAVFIRSDVARMWIEEAVPDLKKGASQDAISLASQLARSGMIKRICAKVRRYPSSKMYRRQGIMWGDFNPESPIKVQIVGKGKDGKPGIVSMYHQPPSAAVMEESPI